MVEFLEKKYKENGIVQYDLDDIAEKLNEVIKLLNKKDNVGDELRKKDEHQIAFITKEHYDKTGEYSLEWTELALESKNQTQEEWVKYWEGTGWRLPTAHELLTALLQEKIAETKNLMSSDNIIGWPVGRGGDYNYYNLFASYGSWASRGVRKIKK